LIAKEGVVQTGRVVVNIGFVVN